MVTLLAGFILAMALVVVGVVLFVKNNKDKSKRIAEQLTEKH
jgi:hypothetical protein